MKSLIFTAGYIDGDDSLMKSKGHRSDILLLDEENRYFKLNFITLERLALEMESSLNKEKGYYFDDGLIVVDDLSLKKIISCIKDLIRLRAIDDLMPFEALPKDNWHYVVL